MKDLKKYEQELATKFGLNDTIGYGNHRIYDPETKDLIKTVHVKHSWIAHVRFNKYSFLIGYLRADHTNLAVFLPDSLSMEDRQTVQAVELESKSVSRVLQSFNLIDDNEGMIFGTGDFDIEMSIRAYHVVSQFTIYSGSEKYNHSSHYELFRALLSLSKEIVQSRQNEALNNYARGKRWLS